MIYDNFFSPLSCYVEQSFCPVDSEEFNRILHNARPDALEIQDIVQFYFVLLDRIEKHIAAKSAVAIVD